MPKNRQRSSSIKNTPRLATQPALSEKATAEDVLGRIAQLDQDERERLINQIIFDRDAPLHDDLDMILQTCLHAMKSAVHVFVSCRDRPSNGGRLWAAQVLQGLKRRCSWKELLQKIPSIPEAVRAVKLLSPDWQDEPLWIDGTPRPQEYEAIRKAIRDQERHVKTKVKKADEVYHLVVDSLPDEFREAFPGIESYLRLY